MKWFEGWRICGMLIPTGGGGGVNNRRSTTGYVRCLCGWKSYFWRTKLQEIATLSSIKAKYVAVVRQYKKQYGSGIWCLNMASSKVLQLKFSKTWVALQCRPIHQAHEAQWCQVPFYCRSQGKNELFWIWIMISDIFTTDTFILQAVSWQNRLHFRNLRSSVPAFRSNDLAQAANSSK